MADEYNAKGDELNKPIGEYKRFDAIEYPRIKESAAAGVEVLSFLEDSSEVSKPPKVTRTSKDFYEEQRARLDNYKKFRNTAETGKVSNTSSTSSTTGGSSTGGSGTTLSTASGSTASATTTASTASTASAAGGVSTATVVSTTALTGITIIAAGAAFATGSMGTGIFDKAPKINPLSIVVGADYVQYELDIQDLVPGKKYKINLTLEDTIVYEIDVTEPGVQRAIIPGLEPFLTYRLSVLGKNGIYGYSQYKSFDCYTSISHEPDAAMTFTPIIDFENGIFDVYYEAYISDFYHVGDNPYIELFTSSANAAPIINREVDNRGIISGTITGVRDAQEISANAYLSIGENQSPTLIKSFNYKAAHPEGFVPRDEQYFADYTFDNESIQSVYNMGQGYNISFDLGYDNSADDREFYNLVLYDENGEVITSKSSTDPTVELNIPAKNKYFKAVLEKSKHISDTEDKVVDTEELEYTVSDTLFEKAEMRISDSGCYYESELSPIFEGASKENKTIFHLKDGRTITPDELIDESSYYSIEYPYSDLFEYEDLDHVEIITIVEDEVVGDFNFYPEAGDFIVSDFEVSDEGNIVIPYEFKNTDRLEFEQTFIAFESGGLGGYEETNSEGEIVISQLYDGIISFECETTYRQKDGTTLTLYNRPEDINLNADLIVSSYVTYESSELDFNVNMYATVKEIPVNMCCKLQWLERQEVAGEYSNVYNLQYLDMAYGKYVSLDIVQEETEPYVYKYYYSYKIESTGFIDSGVEKTVDIDTTTVSDIGNKSGDAWDVSFGRAEDDLPSIDYIKTENDDGTVNYYFNTLFTTEASDTSHDQRLSYTYEEDGVKKTVISDYFDESYYIFENLPDYDYTFNYYPYYHYNNIDYCISTETKAVDKSVPKGVVMSDYCSIDTTDTQTEMTVRMKGYDIDQSSGFIFTFDGNEYEIPYEDENSSIATVGVDGDRYYIDYTINKGEVSFSVNIFKSPTESTITFVITSPPFEVGYNNYPTVEYKYIPRAYLDLKDNIKNVNYPITVVDNLYEYTGNMDLQSLDDINYNVSTDSAGTHIAISFDDKYDSTDERDRLRFIANDEYGNELSYIDVYAGDYGTDLYVPTYVPKINLVVQKIKVRYGTAMVYDTIELGQIEAEPVEIINQMIITQEPTRILFEGSVDNAYINDELQFTLRPYYVDGTDDFFYNTATKEAGETTFSNAQSISKETKYVEITVRSQGNVIAVYDYYINIEDSKTFNGATCTIEYTIGIPDGCQIDYDKSTFDYTGGQVAIESTSGSVEISAELDTYEYNIVLVDRYGRSIHYIIVKNLSD